MAMIPTLFTYWLFAGDENFPEKRKRDAMLLLPPPPLFNPDSDDARIWPHLTPAGISDDERPIARRAPLPEQQDNDYATVLEAAGLKDRQLIVLPAGEKREDEGVQLQEGYAGGYCGFLGTWEADCSVEYFQGLDGSDHHGLGGVMAVSIIGAVGAGALVALVGAAVWKVCHRRAMGRAGRVRDLEEANHGVKPWGLW